MDTVLRPLYAALLVLSGSASIGGNLLLLLVLLLNRELRSEAPTFTLSAGLSDLALALSTVPFAVHNTLTGPVEFSSEGALCQGSGFIFLLLQTSSIQSLTWVTVDKFSEICFALSYRSVWTVRRSRAALVLLWLFSAVNASLPLVGFGKYHYSEPRSLCCPDFTPGSRYFVAFWVTFGIAVPIVFMCFLHGCIVCVARKQARRGTFICNELHCFHVPANNYLRSSMVIVTSSVSLLLCWLPYVSVSFYETFSGRQSPAVISALSTWLVLTSSALNPWISCLTQTYREVMFRGFRTFCQKCSGMMSRPRNAVFHLNAAETHPSLPNAAVIQSTENPCRTFSPKTNSCC